MCLSEVIFLVLKLLCIKIWKIIFYPNFLKRVDGTFEMGFEGGLILYCFRLALGKYQSRI